MTDIPSPQQEVLQIAEQDVVAGALTSLEAVDRVARKLETSFILDAHLRSMLSMIMLYTDRTSGLPTPEMLGNLIQRQSSDVAKGVLIQQLAEKMLENPIPDDRHRWAVDVVQDHAQYRQLKEALRSTTELLARGARTPEGSPPHVQAREQLSGALSEIERMGSAEDAPEGSTNQEGSKILAAYASRKDKAVKGISIGVPFGIAPLDNIIGGMGEAELILVAAGPHIGKTHFCINTAHDAAMHGHDIIFFTSETVYEATRRRLIACHSAAMVEQRGEGTPLNTKHLRDGTLTEEHEILLKDTVTDWTSNSSYGDFHLSQVPLGGTIHTVEGRAVRANRRKPRTLIVIDYLALLKPTKSRQSQQAEIVDTLRDAKNFAASFDSGRGIAIVSPWHMSREAGKESLKTGRYNLDDLALTSEAEKTSDMILAIWAPEDQDDKSRIQAKVQVLKNRDGESGGIVDVEMDYRCAKITPAHTAGPGNTAGLSDLFSDSESGWN